MIGLVERHRPLIDAAQLTRSRWSRAGVAILLGAGAVIAAGALLAVSGWLISRAAQRPEILLLGVAIVGVRFFGISRALLRYAERLVSHDLAFRALTDLRQRFFARLVPLVPGTVPARADLLSRFVADADRMQDLYLRAIAPPAIGLVAGIVAVGVAAIILPVGGLVLLGALAMGAVAVPLLTARLARSAGRNQAGARAELATRMVEVTEGAPEIALAGRESDWELRVKHAGARLSSVLRRDALAGGVAVGASAAIAAGAAVAMAAVGIGAASDSAMNGIMIASLVMLALATVEITSPLATAATTIDAVSDAAARLEQVTDRPLPIAVDEQPQAVPATGALELRDVAFAYPGGAPVLDGADLTLAPGEAVALVGPSGVGKSTIADLLVRFLDPDAGAVTLGGTDLRVLDPDAVRDAVRLAPQDAYLFATDIRNNLRVGNPEADDADVYRALDAVGLGDWVAGLTTGLNTEVGDAGSLVSGGQRQRLAMARAVISDARFLILDEPTSHLDPAGAADLLDALAAIAHGSSRGVLVITHERSGLDRFDRVLELRDGRLTEADPGPTLAR